MFFVRLKDPTNCLQACESCKHDFRIVFGGFQLVRLAGSFCRLFRSAAVGFRWFNRAPFAGDHRGLRLMRRLIQWLLGFILNYTFSRCNLQRPGPHPDVNSGILGTREIQAWAQFTCNITTPVNILEALSFIVTAPSLNPEPPLQSNTPFLSFLRRYPLTFRCNPEVKLRANSP